MKKIFCFIIAVLLCFSAFGCNVSNQSDTQSTPESDEETELSALTETTAIPDSTETTTRPDFTETTTKPTAETTTRPGPAATTTKPSAETTAKPQEDPDPTFDPDETLPHLADEEKSPIAMDGDTYVIGKFIGKLSPNVLVLKIYNDECMIEQWGKYVYIITDQEDLYDYYDDYKRWQFKVSFSYAERPNDPTQYIRIYSDFIEIDPSTIHVYKPIIYLYPEGTTECSVQLTLNGALTCTYPAYGTDGWSSFTAHPDGTLVFPNGKEYYALYWEGILDTEWDFAQGFCVRGEDTAAFLEWALLEQGLTPRETNEFIIYWLPLMQGNRYNVISFQTTAYTESAILEIDPSPDSLLRVFMAYYASDIPIDIEPQSFDTFIRQGFTVVEWGGTQTLAP